MNNKENDDWIVKACEEALEEDKRRKEQERQESAAEEEQERERKAKEEKVVGIGCGVMIASVVAMVPLAFIAVELDYQPLIYLSVVGLFAGFCMIVGNPFKNNGDASGYSSSGGLSSWLTPPKNPRYLRRKIRHGRGW